MAICVGWCDVFLNGLLKTKDMKETKINLFLIIH